MITKKTISQILIFSFIFLICIFTTACSSENNSGISIQHESKIQNFQKQGTSNSKIVYLGNTNDNSYNIGNFGPRDIYFEGDNVGLR